MVKYNLFYTSNRVQCSTHVQEAEFTVPPLVFHMLPIFLVFLSQVGQLLLLKHCCTTSLPTLNLSFRIRKRKKGLSFLHVHWNVHVYNYNNEYGTLIAALISLISRCKATISADLSSRSFKVLLSSDISSVSLWLFDSSSNDNSDPVRSFQILDESWPFFSMDDVFLDVSWV